LKIINKSKKNLPKNLFKELTVQTKVN